ncbi:MAG: hypothetical protein J2P21_01785 [Chloracidobacterium sp.]|nr:hypothetical protein [Chloracidobacterium sp.]
MQHHDALGAGAVFFGPEYAAQRGLDAEHLKKLRRDSPAGQSLGVAVSGQRPPARPHGRHSLERLDLNPQVDEIRMREVCAGLLGFNGLKLRTRSDPS